jgi:putative flippase GtrA
VRFVRALYARFRLLIHEGARFSTVGVVAFLVNGVGANLLHFGVGVGPLTSDVIATVGAVTVSYVGHRYWTFRYRQRTGVGREGLVFFGLNGLGLVMQLGCLGFTANVLGLDGRLWYNGALVIGVGLGAALRYWSYRKWVWPARQPAPPAEAQPLGETVLC